MGTEIGGLESGWSDLKVLNGVMRPDGELSTFASFVTERGEPGLKPS